MPEHTCMRRPDSDPKYLGIVREGDPEACGKIAHFTWKTSEYLKDFPDDNIAPAWLCAECYDFVTMIFAK